jgi:thiol-disulfide isomerase/thioredoxin
MKTFIWIILSIGAALSSIAQPVPAGWWRASLQRQDGNTIDFNIDVQNKNGKPIWYLRNASEKIPITAIQQKQDSVLVQMPLFESEFRLKKENNRTLRGVWIKGTSSNKPQVMPVVFVHNQPLRFPSATGKPIANISGRWATTFVAGNDTTQAISELAQNGNRLTGTVLTPTGDYRYLEGSVHKDTLQLSTFDGSHAYYFRAVIKNDALADGLFVSGASYRESWTAVRNAKAKLPDSLAAAHMKDGEDKFNFRFPDLDSNMVSIRDPRFQNKVVVLQLMGSWCPNCMDETAFLSNFYNTDDHPNIEMIALAYEYSTDFQRSQKSLRKFQQHFNIKYPMLITGVRVGDSLRTEKTLPQMSPIKMFPTTIFIGRDGKVKKIHTGFFGPGTGEHYEAYKKDFYATIDELLKEKL